MLTATQRNRLRIIDVLVELIACVIDSEMLCLSRNDRLLADIRAIPRRVTAAVTADNRLPPRAVTQARTRKAR